MALILKVVALLAALFTLISLGAAAIQRRLMYAPDTARTNPASVGLRAVQEVVIRTADGERVLAWYGAAAPGEPTILYFHGNGGSLVTRTERIAKYMARGLGVFMMTYRGYGGSTGRPSEKANVSDAKAAYDALVQLGVEPALIFVYGESLGTGVAAQVAAARASAGLILDAPFTSMLDLATLHYPQLPARWLMSDHYRTTDYIRRVKAPLLILHGEEDTIIPVGMGRAVFDLARQPKEIAIFPGAGHSDHYLFGSYETLYAWIAKHKPKASVPTAKFVTFCRER
ncbi:MAG: alpha/beta fold hydrolase [Hyphomicrobium sp.]|jgi:hypothetical protein